MATATGILRARAIISEMRFTAEAESAQRFAKNPLRTFAFSAVKCIPNPQRKGQALREKYNYPMANTYHST
jgi:hypothetical protein